MKTLILRLLKSVQFWLIVALVISIGIIALLSHQNSEKREEIDRLESNQTSLLADVEYYTAENGELVASINALSLRKAELEDLMPQYEREIKNLRLKVSDLESMAHISTETKIEVTAPIIEEPIKIDSITTPSKPIIFERAFHFTDEWVTLDGVVKEDAVDVDIKVVDSLTIVAYRKPKKCLFKRKGKIVRYDVVSANPHTKINKVSYIELME